MYKNKYFLIFINFGVDFVYIIRIIICISKFLFVLFERDILHNGGNIMKKSNIDYPAYLELGIKNGHVSSVNGKEFNEEGVETIIEYVCRDENIAKSDVFDKIKCLNENDGSVTLKLYNGAVTAI